MRQACCPSRTFSLPFKGRVGVGMGSKGTLLKPIPLPTSPLKGEEQFCRLGGSFIRLIYTISI